MADRAPQVGFYGKLPSHGDFLRRRVSDAFVTSWDAWLQEGIVASRAALTDRWLDIYLTSPAWRFCAAAGACGPAALVGVMVPSVDRVGRYFPLTIVAELPELSNVVTLAAAVEPFFDAAERLLVETLDADPVDFDAFDLGVVNLAPELARGLTGRPLVVDAVGEEVLRANAAMRWHAPLGSTRQLRPLLEQLAAQRLLAQYAPLVMWWTEGSAAVEPSCALGSRLPPADSFVSLLDGSWADRGWRLVPAQAEAPPLDERGPVDDRPVFYRSAGASHVGRVRTNNEDAYLERADVGLWVVADGMGGHAHGEVASRMVCNGLADLLPESSLDATIEAATARLRAVNTFLRRGASELYPVNGGSTVVAVLARGRQAAVLWVGDSRVYRWRRGTLAQITTDHSAASTRPGVHDTHEVTRAVGAEPGLAVDVAREAVEPGDRFLLCSDGLTRVLRDEGIQALAGDTDLRRAVEGLVSATLEGGAPDNVTVVLVEAYAP